MTDREHLAFVEAKKLLEQIDVVKSFLSELLPELEAAKHAADLLSAANSAVDAMHKAVVPDDHAANQRRGRRRPS